MSCNQPTAGTPAGRGEQVLLVLRGQKNSHHSPESPLLHDVIPDCASPVSTRREVTAARVQSTLMREKGQLLIW